MAFRWFDRMTPWRRGTGRPEGAYAGYFAQGPAVSEPYEEQPTYRSGNTRPEYDEWDERLRRVESAFA